MQIVRTITSSLVGLLSVSIVIIIHELGHLLACKLFAVPAPLFSIGFGPRIAAVTFGETIYQIAALPLGGFVQIDTASLAKTPYLAASFITLAGVFCNFILAYLIIGYLAWRTRCPENAEGVPCEERINLQKKFKSFLRLEGVTKQFVGPIGIISMLGKSLLFNARVFLLLFALINLNVGIFNLIPLPFLDGGRFLFMSLERLLQRERQEQRL